MTSALSRGGKKGKPNRDDPNNFMTGTVTGAWQGVSKDIFVLSQMNEDSTRIHMLGCLFGQPEVNPDKDVTDSLE